MSKKLLIFGWPNCGYAQKAIEYAKKNNMNYEFIDTSKNVPEFLKSFLGDWQSPHIFEYIGGSSELENGRNYQNISEKKGHEGCRNFFGTYICN